MPGDASSVGPAPARAPASAADRCRACLLRREPVELSQRCGILFFRDSCLVRYRWWAALSGLLAYAVFMEWVMIGFALSVSSPYWGIFLATLVGIGLWAMAAVAVCMQRWTLMSLIAWAGLIGFVMGLTMAVFWMDARYSGSLKSARNVTLATLTQVPWDHQRIFFAPTEALAVLRSDRSDAVKSTLRVCVAPLVRAGAALQGQPVVAFAGCFASEDTEDCCDFGNDCCDRWKNDQGAGFNVLGSVQSVNRPGRSAYRAAVRAWKKEHGGVAVAENYAVLEWDKHPGDWILSARRNFILALTIGHVVAAACFWAFRCWRFAAEHSWCSCSVGPYSTTEPCCC